MAQLKKAGVDLTQRATVQAVVDQMDPLVIADGERGGEDPLSARRRHPVYAAPVRRRLLPSAVLRTMTANECAGASRSLPWRHSIPGVRIGVGLSIGIALQAPQRRRHRVSGDDRANGFRPTSPSIGAIVFISATTSGSAPLP